MLDLSIVADPFGHASNCIAVGGYGVVHVVALSDMVVLAAVVAMAAWFQQVAMAAMGSLVRTSVEPIWYSRAFVPMSCYK